MALAGCSARPGAAMWTPTVTVPLPRPCTDSASSISVVLESSIEKACTVGQRQFVLDRRAPAAAGSRCPWGSSRTGSAASGTGRARRSRRRVCSRSSGAVCVAREASTTALYSGAFLSGLNRILYSCSRIGARAGAGGQLRGPGGDLGLDLLLLLDRGQRLLQDLGRRLLEAALAGAAEVVRRLEQAQQRRRLLRQRGIGAEIVARQVGEAEFVLGREFPGQVQFDGRRPAPAPRAAVPPAAASRTSAGCWRP